MLGCSLRVDLFGVLVVVPAAAQTGAARFDLGWPGVSARRPGREPRVRLGLDGMYRGRPNSRPHRTRRRHTGRCGDRMDAADGPTVCTGQDGDAAITPEPDEPTTHAVSTSTPAMIPNGVDAGAPPPARGTVAGAVVLAVGPGITPACAGNRESVRDGMSVPSGSPPPARGTGRWWGGCVARCGITPACAGTAGVQLVSAVRPGSTPACAGNSAHLTRPTFGRWDHPRLRGEQRFYDPLGTRYGGSPPPARGTDCCGRAAVRCGGITPACAGNRLFQGVGAARAAGSPPPARGTGPDRARAAPWVWDHPRLRGEQAGPIPREQPRAGSPPPARGTGFSRAWGPPARRDHPRLRGEQVRIGQEPRPGCGITPACAGNSC